MNIYKKFAHIDKEKIDARSFILAPDLRAIDLKARRCIQKTVLIIKKLALRNRKSFRLQKRASNGELASKTMLHNAEKATTDGAPRKNSRMRIH